MPRGNLYTIVVLIVLALVCHQQVPKEPLRSGHCRCHGAGAAQLPGAGEIARALRGRHGKAWFGAWADDYSSYIGPKSLSVFKESIEHEFEGVGMEVAIDPKTKQLMVLCPLLGTPAFEAGIRAGDHILSIDGQRTDEMAFGGGHSPSARQAGRFRRHLHPP